MAIRRAEEADLDAIFDLLVESLGWMDDVRHRRLFAWKHRENPAGESPMWVAVDQAGRVVAFRSFMRWTFVGGVAAARAVDTATAASHRGRGLFTRLTLHGLAALESEGVEFVFNTPNDASRPGYLKMGWSEVGHLPVYVSAVRASRIGSIFRSRVPADLWSLETSIGLPAPRFFADPANLEAAVSLAAADVDGLATFRSSEYLRWRYGLSELGYRVVTLENDPTAGIAVVRMRRRGEVVESTLVELLVPRPRSVARLMMRRVGDLLGADYVIGLGARPGGALPLPGRGPMLTFRPVAGERIATPEFSLSLGDVELF